MRCRLVYACTLLLAFDCLLSIAVLALGYDIGAVVAAGLAAKHPDIIRSLFMLSPAGIEYRMPFYDALRVRVSGEVLMWINVKRMIKEESQLLWMQSMLKFR